MLFRNNKSHTSKTLYILFLILHYMNNNTKYFGAFIVSLIVVSSIIYAILNQSRARELEFKLNEQTDNAEKVEQMQEDLEECREQNKDAENEIMKIQEELDSLLLNYSDKLNLLGMEYSKMLKQLYDNYNKTLLQILLNLQEENQDLNVIKDNYNKLLQEMILNIDNIKNIITVYESSNYNALLNKMEEFNQSYKSFIRKYEELYLKYDEILKIINESNNEVQYADIFIINKDGYLYNVQNYETTKINTFSEASIAVEWAWEQLKQTGGIIWTTGPGETWYLNDDISSQGDGVTWYSDRSLEFKARPRLNKSPVYISHDNITLVGLEVNGGEAEQTGDLSCILFNGSKNCQAVRCEVSFASRILNARGEGIELLNCSMCGIFDCYGYYCDHDVFKIRNSTSCTIQGSLAKPDNEKQQSGGIQLYFSEDCSVLGNIIHGQGRENEHGIKLHAASSNLILGNEINNVGRMGIYLIGKNGETNYNIISNNYITNVNLYPGDEYRGYGIFLEKHFGNEIGYVRNNMIVTNYITDCSGGIRIVDFGNSILNNIIKGTHKLINIASNSNYSQIISNKIYGTGKNTEYGIFLQKNVNHCLIEGNYIQNIGENQGYQGGIILYGSNNFNTIINNYILNITRFGIRLDSSAGSSNYNKISNNNMNRIGTGISINGPHEYNDVTENKIYDATYYGVSLWNGAAYTTLKDNTFHNVKTEIVSLNNAGIGTRFQTIIIPFRSGNSYTSSINHPWGYEITEPEDHVLAFIKLPLDCHKVFQIKIWSVSKIDYVKSMNIEIYGSAGGQEEQFDSDTIHVPNLKSYSSNFQSGDIIYWNLGAWVDEIIDSLTGGDIIQLKIIFESEDNDNCATNAVFQLIEIEYY